MTDPQAIVQGLQAVKAALDIVKGLHGVEGAYQQADLKMKISDLASLLVDARMGLLEAKEEVDALKGKIADLEKAQDVREQLTLRNQVYYRQEGDKETGPFCVRCFEMNLRLMPVRRLSAAFVHLGEYKCPECQAVY